MNNEPVAWIQAGELAWDYELIKKGRSEEMMNDKIPLYIHPAKTLTDEEKLEVIHEWSKAKGMREQDLIGLCDAVLKKASGK